MVVTSDNNGMSTYLAYILRLGALLFLTSITTISLADNLVAAPDSVLSNPWTYNYPGYTLATKFTFTGNFSITSIGLASQTSRTLYVYKNGNLLESLTTATGSLTSWANTDLSSAVSVGNGDALTIVTQDGADYGEIGGTAGRGFKQMTPPYYIDIDLAYSGVEVASYTQYGPASTFSDNTNGVPGIWSYAWFNVNATPTSGSNNPSANVAPEPAAMFLFIIGLPVAFMSLRKVNRSKAL